MRKLLNTTAKKKKKDERKDGEICMSNRVKEASVNLPPLN